MLLTVVVLSLLGFFFALFAGMAFEAESDGWAAILGATSLAAEATQLYILSTYVL